MNRPLRTALAIAVLGLSGVAHAEGPQGQLSLNGLGALNESLIKQSAYFEANQVVRRFFLCIPEASNHKLDPKVMDEVRKCFDETVDENIEIDIGGKRSRGRAAALAIATQGLATIRQNTTFSLSAPYISHYQAGRRIGTGSIALNFNALVHQDITARSSDPQPFDPTPGPQLFVSNDTLGLMASVPGQWKITLLKVNPLMTQLSPNIQFNTPFPHYPIASQPAQRN
ncbi:MAG: hypothetical protein ABWY06_14915 [Pseudomonas sp.]|uniref:hypothetical protein n=1 Tax=Pseudomonas sp. TaxID=306 RepID=UPI0033997BED